MSDNITCLNCLGKDFVEKDQIFDINGKKYLSPAMVCENCDVSIMTTSQMDALRSLIAKQVDQKDNN